MKVLLKYQTLNKSYDINDLVEDLCKGGQGSGVKGHKTPKQVQTEKDEESLKNYIRRVHGAKRSPDETVEILNTKTFGVVTPSMVQDWVDSGKVIIIPPPPQSKAA